VCTIFGFAKDKNENGGFAGLAAFSDMQILLFPVPTMSGPIWITCPMALQPLLDDDMYKNFPKDNVLYTNNKKDTNNKTGFLNLGWLYLPIEPCPCADKFTSLNIPNHISENFGVVSDKLFSHIVNSNLEVRTSVAIDPTTGAAKDTALFTYEAIPRHTVLTWETIYKEPKHFKMNNKDIQLTVQKMKDDIACANNYLEYLGIGGMGTRGMGRLKVFGKNECGSQGEEK